MTNRELVEKRNEKIREDLLTFRTSLKELKQSYSDDKEVMEFVDSDKTIHQIEFMKEEVHKMDNWSGMLIGDAENVIATFYDSDNKTSMMHYRLTEDSQLKLINGWKVNGKHNVIRNNQMIRENNLYLVTEGTTTVGVYDYHRDKFLVDMYEIRIQDPTQEEILAIVEDQKEALRVKTKGILN